MQLWFMCVFLFTMIFFFETDDVIGRIKMYVPAKIVYTLIAYIS